MAHFRGRRVMWAGSSVWLFAMVFPALADPAGPAAVAQATTDNSATDIGRVTANGGTANGESLQAKPSGTGTRAQAKAAEHAAINKIIVQPESEIQKLPDISVAQALSRLPGVSMETDSGEGRFIDIRGLDADLNATTFDGVRILPSNLSSPTGGGRAVAYDVLPAGLIGGIEVSETLRPEDDAEGLGGLVNLLPRRLPSDGQPFVNVTAGMGLETLRNTQVQDFGINAGASFGIQTGHGPFDHPVSGGGFMSNPKPFSFFFTDTQHNDYRGVDDFEPSYSDQQSAGAPDKLLNGVNLRHYLYNRRRFSRGGEFDFDPNDTDHFFVRYAIAGYNEHAEKDFLNLNALDSGFNNGTGFIYPGDKSGRTFLAPNAYATRTNTDTEEELRNQILEWGGRNVLFDTVKIDYHGAYSEGTDKFPTSYGSSFSTPTTTDANGNTIGNIPIAYNNQINSAHLFYQTLNGTNLLNQNIYTQGNVSNSPSSSRDREYSGEANVTVPLTLLTPDDEFKTGAEIRLRDRIVQSSGGITANIPGTLGQYTSGPSLDFYNGYYNIGPSINAATVNGFLGGQAAPYDPTAFQHDQENVYSTYAQYGGKWGKLSFLAGMRLESTFGVYQQAPGQANDVTFKHAYSSYFPSAQLKYDVTPAMDVRAVYSTAIGRPGFDQISPGAVFSASGPSVNVGNPNLSPEYADSFDVFWEYYLPRGGKVSLGGFDKELNTFIFQDTINAVVGSAAFPNALIGPVVPVTYRGQVVPVTTYSNSGPSRVYGVEAEYTQQFLFLPAPFDGFGIDSNLTYNQSSAQITRTQPDGVVGTETLQQPQTSPWNFNASLFYEKDPITFRLAANYVSKDLYSLGGTKATDVYVQQRFRLDLGTAYQVTKHIQFYFDAHNLTDQTLKYTETASTSRPIQREFYGIDVMGGIRVNY